MAQKPKRAARPRQAYHHGNLRQALVDATLALVEERGVEGVSVREAAKRAGVSSGAPFRHFQDRTALMTAVAEEAQRRLDEQIAAVQRRICDQPPLERFRAIGRAYLHWAFENPTHFQIISTKGLADFESSATLREGSSRILGQMDALIGEAQADGSLAAHELTLVRLAGRALVYGLGRMYIDGHYPRWGIAEADAERVAQAVLDLFSTSLAVSPAPGAVARARLRPRRRVRSG